MYILRYPVSNYIIIMLILFGVNALVYIQHHKVKPALEDTLTAQIQQKDKEEIMNMTTQDLPIRGSKAGVALLTQQPIQHLRTDLFGGLPFLNLRSSVLRMTYPDHEGFAYDHAAHYYNDIGGIEVKKMAVL